MDFSWYIDMACLDENTLGFVYRNNSHDSSCVFRTVTTDDYTLGKEFTFDDDSYNKVGINVINNNIYVSRSNNKKGYLDIVTL